MRITKAPDWIQINADLPAGYQLTFTPLYGKPPSSRRLTQLVPQLSVQDYCVHDPTANNVLDGVIQRVMLVDGARPPQPVPGAWPLLLRFTRRIARRLPRHVSRMAAADYPLLYSGKKRETYHQAELSLRVKPIQQEDAKLSVFGKCEKVPLRSDGTPKAMRVISPRDPRYNLELGTFLHPIERHVYKAINSMFHNGPTTPTVQKFLNLRDRGRVLRAKWNMFKDPIAVGYDAKRFDQHTSADAMQVEHAVYLAAYARNPELNQLRKLLRWQLRTSAKAVLRDGIIKYRTRGNRCSGDVNTSLGNIILMCIMMKAYFEHANVNVELVNDGDDCVLFLERDDLPRLDGLEPYFLDLGYTMIREPPVDVFEQLEFCQCHPVFDGQDWTMVRKLDTVMSKDTITVKSMTSDRAVHVHRRRIRESGLSMAGNIPVLRSVYSYIGRGCETMTNRRGKFNPYMDSGLFYSTKGMRVKDVEPTPLARLSYWRATGLSPRQQVAMERRLDQLPAFHHNLGVIYHRFGAAMFAQHGAEPPDLTGSDPLRDWTNTMWPGPAVYRN